MEITEDTIITASEFEALLRKNTGELSAFLEEVEISFLINETKAYSNCHFIKLSGNGQVRFKDFACFLAKKIIDFSIPASEITEAKEFYDKTNSTSKFAALHQKASSLFSSLKKSGEGGEVLLYILIEELLKSPQILCKMSLKTSSEMHVHGCDGIHASYDDDNDKLSLFWGESKLYQNLTKALTACFDSLKDFLIDSGGTDAAQTRDIQLIRSYVDFNNPKLEDAIVNFLDKDNPQFNKVIYKGACLVGFDYSDYPSLANSSITIEVLKTTIETHLAKWKDSLKEKILSVEHLEKFELHIFLIPFPSVQDFRDAFLSELGIKRTHDLTQ